VNTRSTIGIGWVFVTEHQNFHVEGSFCGSVDIALHQYRHQPLLSALTVKPRYN
jgi:hypothetical protein